MNSFLADVLELLVQVAFGFYILAVLLRLLFQLVRADFYNPVSQFIVALTNPSLRPLRRVIPGLFGIDLASVVLLVGLQALELYLLHVLRGYPVNPVGLFFFAVVELVRLTINVFFFAIIIRVLMSWFMPFGMRHHPVGNLLVSLTEPLMAPARRWLPPIAGFDLSPILVLLLLQIALLALRHFAG
jgi:YggT family protein